jgi:PAS domain S-box-containing protein
MSLDDLNFIPIDREIMLHPDKPLVCKYNPEGVIDYVNSYFTEISGYEVHEVVGMTPEKFVHRDIPEVIKNYVKERITLGRNVNVLLKDQAKDGRHYWYMTNFDYKFSDQDEVLSVMSHRLIPPRILVNTLDPLYQKLKKIELHSGLDVAQKYFEGFIEEKGMNFEEYSRAIVVQQRAKEQQLSNQLNPSQEPPKKSLLGKLFK